MAMKRRESVQESIPDERVDVQKSKPITPNQYIAIGVAIIFLVFGVVAGYLIKSPTSVVEYVDQIEYVDKWHNDTVWHNDTIYVNKTVPEYHNTTIYLPPPEPPTIIEGVGDTVTTPVNLTEGLYSVYIDYPTDSYFHIHLYNQDGVADLYWVQEFSQYTGSRMLSISKSPNYGEFGPGTYYIEVSHSGEWLINITRIVNQTMDPYDHIYTGEIKNILLTLSDFEVGWMLGTPDGYANSTYNTSKEAYKRTFLNDRGYTIIECQNTAIVFENYNEAYTFFEAKKNETLQTHSLGSLDLGNGGFYFMYSTDMFEVWFIKGNVVTRLFGLSGSSVFDENDLIVMAEIVEAKIP